MTQKISLAGEWSFGLFAEKPDDNAPLTDSVTLPSTVSQMKKSPVTDERSDGYLTDPHAYEGFAVYERTVRINKPDGEEIFLVLERTRTSRVYINGTDTGTENSLCTPHKYNITQFVTGGDDVLRIVIDNVSCPVPGGHMTSKDTQTNWLGITGEIYIERTKKRRLENIRLFPDTKRVGVRVTGDVTDGAKLPVTLSVDGFPDVSVTASGSADIFYEMNGAKLWDEHDPALYTMKISAGGDVSEVTFGIREFSVRGTDMLLNGRKIFLRGKHDGMIFPLTGAAPTDKESWLKVLRTAKEYGINHYRFHTCCPPEAAFAAADELGVYMEPELPFWGTVEDELTDGQRYLIREGERILDAFGDHPSFFAMSLGNELWGSKERLNDILGEYKKRDRRHLYTQGSNNYQFVPCVLENDDFFVGVRFSKERLFRGSYAMCDAPLGHIQTDAPNSDHDYDKHIRPENVGPDNIGPDNIGLKSAGGTIEIQYGTGVKTVEAGESEEFVSRVPVVSHEIGQYFIYPDYNGMKKYTGVLKPYNFEIFRERLEKAGLSHLEDKYFRASGALAADCYKREIEAALRSKELSGFQLLDLQDFTGQGTALVGILDPFVENKGLISAEKWRYCCSDRVLLGCLPKFVFASGEKVKMPVKLYNYSAEAYIDPRVHAEISSFPETGYALASQGKFGRGVFDLGVMELEMPEVTEPVKTALKLSCGDISNEYTIVIFPEADISDVKYCTDWNEAKEKLSRGEKVLFMPDTLPESKSVEGTYCADFWNYPMFRSISEWMKKPVPVGTLGLLIESGAPSLKGFPTEIFSEPQWYDAVTDSRAAVLDGTGLEPIVRTIDNCERNHSLGDIFEAKTGGGSLLVCTFRLDKKTESLSCRQLMRCLSDYVSSDGFEPRQSIDIKTLDGIFGG